MTEKTTKKNNTPKTTKKLVLYEAVQENPTKNFIIMGALSKAGLLEKYRKEEKEHGIENLKPSITESELNKIIKEFVGE